MPAPTPPATPRARATTYAQERRRQIRGSILLAIAILVFSLLRAGLHTVFTPGWWRLW